MPLRQAASRYDDLRGPSLWNHVEHLLDIWETIGDLCDACEIYRKEIRPLDKKLGEALDHTCGCRWRLSSTS